MARAADQSVLNTRWSQASVRWCACSVCFVILSRLWSLRTVAADLQYVEKVRHPFKMCRILWMSEGRRGEGSSLAFDFVADDGRQLHYVVFCFCHVVSRIQGVLRGHDLGLSLFGVQVRAGVHENLVELRPKIGDRQMGPLLILPACFLYQWECILPESKTPQLAEAQGIIALTLSTWKKRFGPEYR